MKYKAGTQKDWVDTIIGYMPQALVSILQEQQVLASDVSKFYQNPEQLGKYKSGQAIYPFHVYAYKSVKVAERFRSSLPAGMEYCEGDELLALCNKNESIDYTYEFNGQEYVFNWSHPTIFPLEKIDLVYCATNWDNGIKKNNDFY